MKIFYATTNQGKVKSLKRELPPEVKLTQISIDLPEPRLLDVGEIAMEKAYFAFRAIKKPVVVLDAGCFISALNGFPATFVNFTLKTIGLDGILKLMEGKRGECEFRECLAYQDHSLAKPVRFDGVVRGFFSREPRGVLQKHHWSELSLVFIPEGETKTLTEMTPEEYIFWSRERKKQSVSRMFAKWLTVSRKID